MVTSDMTVSVKARIRGLWRVKVATFVARWVRPKRLAAWLVCWLVDGKFGADVKVGDGEWQRGPRAKVMR